MRVLRPALTLVTLFLSTGISVGAECIVVKVNRRRALGEQVAVVFDGRAASPAEVETETSPGYELR